MGHPAFDPGRMLGIGYHLPTKPPEEPRADMPTLNEALIYRYVPLHKVEAYVAQGWIATGSLDDTHHGFWSALMYWAGKGEPPDETPAT